MTRFSFPVLEMPVTQEKFLERLKDDFIVREPRKEVEKQAEKEAPSSVPVAPKPTPEEKPQLQLAAPRESNSAPREQQAVLPFQPEL